MRKWIAAAALAALSISAWSFDINGTKWPGGSTHIHTGIPGTSPAGVAWSRALQDAVQEWNQNTLFSFDMIPSYLDPCQGYGGSSSSASFPSGAGDGLNGAAFTSTVCGNSYGTNVLAVTLVFTEANQLGSWDITEADMVFNSNRPFDVYDGPSNGSSATDFTRVALHELGHVIGIGHSTSLQAIMRATIGNLFTLQPDDIAAANTLYGGYTNCPVMRLDFGVVSGQLSSGDCRVQTLMGGGTDTSLVDVYQFELQQTTKVNLSMVSTTLDSVLVLMNSRSEVIDLDDDVGQGCNSSISRTLTAGTYAVLANTFVTPTDCAGTSGAYKLTASYESSALLTQGRKASFQGGTTTATFSGGVTINNGASYSNTISSTQEFDAVGRINIDPAHRNKPGFLVVAAIVNGSEILVKHPTSGFVPLSTQSSAIPITTSKVLGATETVDILSDFVAARLGITQINVGFLIGYGVEENPGELYFHQEPISLVVTP
ncbi:MAG: hypothetical protein A3H44_10315 [Gammaproteobacteria bacterium RIFCSPLOWO2_02_FULL_57_10]|nr:MAG: hypothetical protein A3H44_10315 [Gammaproteobacteria bacterium RIFCSPLOWO2_02_FULL_57_10]